MTNQHLKDIPESILLEAQCSIQDQLEVYYLVEYFAEAQHLSRTFGALSLEELTPPPPTYLDILQQLILDGRSPEIIEEVSYHMIAAKDRGKTLFQALIIHLGVKCILQRVSVDECLQILHSIFSPELQDPMIAKKRWVTRHKETQ